MKVRALQLGFHGGRRRVGDVFDVPEGTKATWFAPAGESKAPAAPSQPAKPAPQALSQKAKGKQPKSMTEVLAGGGDDGAADSKDGADLV